MTKYSASGSGLSIGKWLERAARLRAAVAAVGGLVIHFYNRIAGSGTP